MQDLVQALASKGVTCVRARTDPAHHPRAVDGHPELAGQPRGLQGGPGGGQPVRPHLPADDDAGRHARPLARLHHGRGRGGPAGDRHGAPAGLDRDGDRRAAGHQGAGAVARRQVRRRRGRGVQGGRDRGRLRQGDERGVSRQAGRPGGRAHQDAGHRHHHRADPRPQGAGAGERGHGQDHEARLGDRRHGGRAGRQLPVVGIRQGGREVRREDRRPGQPARPSSRPTPRRCSRATS